MQVLFEANESRGRVLKGQLGLTHLVFQMTYQMQQLLHAPLKGRRLVARKDAHRQRVSVQPGKVANYPGVLTGRLDSRSAALRVCVRLSPAMQQTRRSSTAFCHLIGSFSQRRSLRESFNSDASLTVLCFFFFLAITHMHYFFSLSGISQP